MSTIEKSLTIPKTIKKISTINKVDSSIESIYFLGDTIEIDEDNNPFSELEENVTVYVTNRNMEHILKDQVGNATIICEEESQKKLLEKELEVIVDEENEIYESIDSNGVTYEIDAKNGTAKVTKISTLKVNSLIIPETISYEKTSYKVTTVGSNCLPSDSEITEIILEKNVTTIEKEAFKGNKHLTIVRIKGEVYNQEKKALQVGNDALKGLNEYFRLWIDHEDSYDQIVTYRSSILDESASIEFYMIYKVGDEETDAWSQKLHRDPFNIGYILNKKNKTATATPFVLKAGLDSCTTGFTGIKSYTFPHGVEYNKEEYKVIQIKGYPLNETDHMAGCTVRQTEYQSMFTGWVHNQNIISITIPGTIEEITNGTFNWWYELIGVRSRSSLETINIAKYGLKRIGLFCFAYQNNLQNIEIPKTVTDMGAAATKACDKMKVWRIPKGVKVFNDKMYSHVSSIAGCKFKNNVTDLYIELESAKEITVDDGWFGSLGSKVTFHFASAEVYTHFSQKKKWNKKWSKNAKYPGHNQSNGYSFTYSIEYDKEKKENVAYLTGITGTLSTSTLTLPSWIQANDVDSLRVVGIKKSLFENYKDQITSVIMGDTIETVEAGTFDGMDQLTEIILSLNLKNIEEGLLKNTKITQVFLPETILSIGSNSMPFDNIQKVFLETEEYFTENEYEGTLTEAEQAKEEELKNNYLTTLIENLDENGFITSIKEKNIELVVQDPDLRPVLDYSNVSLMSIGNSCAQEDDGTTESRFEDRYGFLYIYNLTTQEASIKKAVLESTEDTNMIVPTYVVDTDQDIVFTISNIERGSFNEIETPFTLEVHADIPTIASLAFSENQMIQEIVFEKDVTLEDYAFAYCSSLESVVFKGVCKGIGKNVFIGSPVLENGVICYENASVSLFNLNDLITIVPVQKIETKEDESEEIIKEYTDSIGIYRIVDESKASFVGLMENTITEYIIPQKIQYTNENNQKTTWDVISIES